MKVAIVAITDGGANLARRLSTGLPDADLWLPERFRANDRSSYFAEPVAQVLPRLFTEYDGLICIMATGIVVRVLAPHLQGKDKDPAVIVCDEKGRHAISLLSGHLGGANELAEQVAELLGGQAVITTATDVNDLPAWDDVARREGLYLEPVANIKHLNSALLRGEEIALVDPSCRVATHFRRVPKVKRCNTVEIAEKLDARSRVFVTHHLIPQLEQSEVLVLRPRDLVVGIGCNRDTSVTEIEAVVDEELERAQLSTHSLSLIASIDAKADEAGLLEYARRKNIPLQFHSAEELNALDVPTAPSGHVMHAVGAKGVCEPAALLSAGPGGRLIVHKQKNGNVTVAVAEKL